MNKKLLSSFIVFLKNQGSSLSLPAHGWVGARATSSLAAHFALRNTASNSAEKKGSPSRSPAVSAVLVSRHQSKIIFKSF